VRSRSAVDPEREVEGLLLTVSLLRVTALSEERFSVVRAPWDSRPTVDREVSDVRPWDRETLAASLPLSVEDLRVGEARASRRSPETLLASRLPEVRWLG